MNRPATPPRLFLRFLRWYCDPKLLDRIEGDLLETYFDTLRKAGQRKADRRFIIDVLLLFRPAIIRPLAGIRNGIKNFNNGMIRNYLTVAWRTIQRNKAFAFINIGGLSLGITCSLLILLWIHDEMTVDSFNSNNDVYNVYERSFSEGKVSAGPWTPGMLASELKLKVPEVKYASGFWTYDDVLFSVNEKRLSFKGCAADSDFFRIFNYTLLKGSATASLKDRDAIALSRNMAEAFFGSVDNAYGNSIRMENRKEFKVTAIFENVPDNASQQFDFVNNYEDLLQSVGWLKSWIYLGPFTYIQLQPGTDVAATEAKIKDFLTPYLPVVSGEGFRRELGLQAYSEMYLHSNFEEGVPAGGRIDYVKLFGLIAAFILLIACINFMNLSTARSVNRAKEVGVRKTMGAFRSYLILQFISEAWLLTLFAVVLSLVFVAALLPYFNLLTEKHILLPFTSPAFWLGLLSLVFATGLIAGLYPAFFLSGLNSIRILKGSWKANPGTILFRRALVVFQFILVIAFIAGATVISRQVDFMQNKNLGFDRENLIYIPFQGNLINQYEAFRQQLSARPGIKMVSRSTNAPSSINTHEYDLAWEGKSEDEKVAAIHNGIGYEFIPMMNISLLEGRNFSKDFISDSTGFIINETALRMTGYDNPIGKPLHFLQRDGTIVGVVKDFHLRSLREPIKPLVMFLGEDATWGYVLIKTLPGQTQEAIASIDQMFRQFEPDFPPRYYFADVEFQKLYNSERTVNQLSINFSIIAIFISCLGLLGLTMFTAEQRKKEIGVRKTIGATTFNIVSMLSKDVVKLVFIASFFAIPMVWFSMNQWLTQFAYRTDVSWWNLIVPAIATLLIALLTTSFQAVNAGMADPVKSLRSE